jgi:hypothetical protein
MKGRIIGKRFYVENKEVTEAEFWEAFPPQPLGSGAALFGWKPLVSDALAVHPRQVQEAIADAAKKGVPTEFQKDGRPILRSREHRKAYMKAYGFFDKAAGYGDAQPGSFRDTPDKPDLAKEYF